MATRTARTADPARPWAVYARQSLDRTGAGLAVDRQIEDCLKLGRSLKLSGEPVFYSDNDTSASDGKPRRDYIRLLAALREGKHSALVVWHADRLHRRPIELEEFITAVEASDVRIATVRSGELDLSTPSGRAIARNMGAWARLEVEQKGDRKRRANEQAATLGKRNGGGRSFGYGQTVVGPDGKRRSVDIDKVNRREAAAIRAAFDSILRGESTTSIWKRWNERGLTTQHDNKWDGTTFRNMIKRPTLAGLVTYKGEVLDGVESEWPAIVPLDKWRAVQAIISDPARRTSPGNQPAHLSSGVTFCECEQPLRAGTNSIKSKRTGVARSYTVYRCRSGESGHSTILKNVLDQRVREGVIDALWQKREKPATRLSADDEASLVLINRELGEANTAYDRLADAVEDGTLPKERVKARSAKIATKIEQLNAERERIERRHALAGVDEAAWEAIWAGIDPSAPVFSDPDERGHRKYRPGVVMVRQMMERGMTEAEAKAKLELGRRFDALTLDQQRGLVRAHVRVAVRTTRRGARSTDRIVLEHI